MTDGGVPEAGSATIVVVREPGRSALFLVVHEPLEVGRDCAGVLVADPEVSRRHVVLTPVAGGVEARDLGSRNGSTVDGVAIDQPRTLEPGSVLRIGNTTIEVSELAGPSIRRASVQEATSIEILADHVDPAAAARLAGRSADPSRCSSATSSSPRRVRSNSATIGGSRC